MKNLFQKIILLIALFLGWNSAYSQDGFTVVTRDLETWSTIGLKIKPVDQLDIRLEQGLRLRENSSVVDQILTNLGFRIKPHKNIEFGLGLRYIYDQGQNLEFDNDFRINFDFAIRHKIERWSFKYRFRYQNKNEIGLSTDDGDYYKHYIRFKVGAGYNIKNWKLDPKASVEIFRDMTQYTGGFDNFRWTLGTSYRTKRFGSFGAFYRMERELNSSYPKTTSIIGLDYFYTIEKKKKSKSKNKVD